MKLDKLEILGFKSFADRTTVQFNRGITSVVGPNGCGKTNITEAIRWVLGERRPTALRGSSMQEVIFNGSRERKPTGMAEVTLSFTNTLGLIPLEYPEVAITRRVFRDGESQYLINRAPCNLQDIRDLFMGTGVGSSVYSVIEQKMVDAILSDRAEERRFLFEEAAGVTRYKARRQAALRKLEATENDLTRLGDILNEVRKTTSSLRRQVGKARRFEELQREELRLAAALAAAELGELEALEIPLRETIRSLEEALTRGASERATRETELERLERELTERRAREREVRGRLERESAALQTIERERVLVEEGQRQAAAEADRLTREIAEHEVQAQALLARRQGMVGALSGSAAEAGAARRMAELRTSAVEELTGRFEAAQAALREAHATREGLAEERVRVEAELARSLAERRAAEARRAELEESLAALRRGTPGRHPVPAPLTSQPESPEIPDEPEPPSLAVALGETLADGFSAWPAGAAGAPGSERRAGIDTIPAPHVAAGATVAERALVGRVESLQARLEAAEAELKGRAGAHVEAQRALADIERDAGELAARRRELAARLETLEGLKESFAGFGEGARRALEARQAIAPGLRGPLAREVEVADSRYAAAVEAYLDLCLDALLTPGSEEARAVLEFWRERNQTGVVWALSDTARAAPPRIEAAAEEVLLCRGTEAAGLKGDLDRHRDALFGRLLLAEDLERATELRRRLNSNGSAGWYVVAALTGEILEPSGMVRLPHRKGAREGDGLSRFQQAERLKAALAQVSRDVRRLDTRGQELRASAAALAQAQRAAQERASNLAAELGGAVRELELLHAERRAADTRAAELAGQLAAVGERLARESTAAVASERASEIRRQLEAAEGERSAREDELEALRVEREAALRELGGAELAAQERAAALVTLEREERYLAAGEEEQRRLAAVKQAALARQRDRALALEAETARLATAIEERGRRVEELRASHRAHEDAIQALDAERFERDGEARAARRAHEEAGQRLHVEEMRLSDLIHRRQSIHSVIESEFGHPLAELQAALQAAEGDEPWGHGLPPEVGALRERLRAVRDQKTALGPVNLLALEEFGTEKDRLDFLEAQHADLVKARDGLRQAIRKINATARDLFVETFARTRESFQATFATLFEGGRADISLLDEDDPLESSIEITASPRGKRIQAVNLLSGGERALTAVALLFAIYLVKPSPFCILDEVDAPLDDANIGRFLRMIRSFSDRTQFIIVTHNKRTMEASDFLYGVTMEEPGVSTLVSVDFERRHSFDYGAISPHREDALVGD